MKFLNRLFIFSFISFIIQVIVVLNQYSKGINFDNIAGTFGDGSTHALCYFSLFFIVLIIRLKKKLLILPVILVSIVINYFAENFGFYVLLPFVLLFILNKWIKLSAAAMIISFTVIAFSTVNHWIENYGLNRLTGFHFIQLYDGEYTLADGREVLLGYAVYLGGFFGNGYGAYSEIYNQRGWLLDEVLNRQICISELTHLVSEIGIVGLILTMILYLSVIKRNVKSKKIPFFAMGLFILGIMYNRFLMDERIFFFYFLIILIPLMISDSQDSNQIRQLQYKNSDNLINSSGLA